MSNPIHVITQDTARLRSGTKALSTTAEALASGKANVVLIQSDPANADNVLVGDATSQPFVLQPGDSVQIRVPSLAQIYLKAAANTPTVNWLVT